MPGATMEAVSSVRGSPLQNTRSSPIPASAPATAFACATPSSFSGTSRGSTGEPSSAKYDTSAWRMR